MSLGVRCIFDCRGNHKMKCVNVSVSPLGLGRGKEMRRAVKDTHLHFHTVLICRKAFRLLVARVNNKSSGGC